MNVPGSKGWPSGRKISRNLSEQFKSFSSLTALAAGKKGKGIQKSQGAGTHRGPGVTVCLMGTLVTGCCLSPYFRTRGSWIMHPLELGRKPKETPVPFPGRPSMGCSDLSLTSPDSSSFAATPLQIVAHALLSSPYHPSPGLKSLNFP